MHDYKAQWDDHSVRRPRFIPLQWKVIGDFHKRHRHSSCLTSFLRHIDRWSFRARFYTSCCDNHGTHGRTAEVKAWLRKHPRFVIHYVPTSCSWLRPD